LIFSEPVITPLADGLNLTCMLQLLPGRIGAEHVFVWVKPALAATLFILSVAFPVLLSVTVLAALVVPTSCFLKLRLVGLTEPIAIGVGFAVGVGVDVRVAVLVAVAVALAVAVAVGVRVGVAVPVVVAVGVAVALAVAVAV
jgi:hypothetical protein